MGVHALLDIRVVRGFLEEKIVTTFTIILQQITLLPRLLAGENRIKMVPIFKNHFLTPQQITTGKK